MVIQLKTSYSRIKKLLHSMSTIADRIDPVDLTAGISSPGFNQNPYPFYEQWRKSGSVHWMQSGGYWLIMGYDDVVRALKDPITFSSRPGAGLDPHLVGADPPAHTQVRQSAAFQFSRINSKDLRAAVSSIVRSQMNLVLAKREFDVVQDFAVPLSESALAYVIGFTERETAQLRQICSGHGYQLRHQDEVRSCFIEILASRKKQPADDLLTAMVCNDEHSLTSEQASSILKLFWFAGTTTTSMLISSAVQIWLTNQSARNALLQDPDLLPQFVEETLRFESPEQTAWRVTTADCHIGGKVIPAGANVRLCLSAANRDPDHFTNAHCFDIRRNPNDHVAFGAGPHYCMGASLARLEAEIALRALLLTNFGRFAFREQAVRYIESDHFRGIQRLVLQVIDRK